MNQSQDYLWTERFRPRRVEDCILPREMKDTFNGIIAQGRIPSLLLHGGAGVGKSTIARALCDEIGADYILINASNENGVDTFRSKITQFASTVSLTGAKKVVILDEFDFASSQLQAILRAGTEEVSSNCTFIYTCNFKNKIIEAIHSRCAVIDFKIENKDKPKLASQFFKRVTSILTGEGIEFDPKAVAELITRHFPDYRRILNELQRYSVTGKIDTGILINLGDESFKSLVSHLRDKNFTEVRKWVGVNSDIETAELFRKLYDTAIDNLELSSIPQLVLLLADYGYKEAFSVDPEINKMACMVEIMSSCAFK